MRIVLENQLKLLTQNKNTIYTHMHKITYYIPTTNDLSLMVYDNYSCYLFYCQLYNRYIMSMQKLLSMYFNYATDHSLTYFARNAFLYVSNLGH